MRSVLSKLGGEEREERDEKEREEMTIKVSIPSRSIDMSRAPGDMRPLLDTELTHSRTACIAECRESSPVMPKWNKQTIM